MSKLSKIFAACAVSLHLAGCATTGQSLMGNEGQARNESQASSKSQTKNESRASHTSDRCSNGFNFIGLIYYKSYDQTCGEDETARTLVNSDHPEARVLGATMIRNRSREARRAFDDVLQGKGTTPEKEARICTVDHLKQGGKGKGDDTSLTCRRPAI